MFTQPDVTAGSCPTLKLSSIIDDMRLNTEKLPLHVEAQKMHELQESLQVLEDYLTEVEKHHRKYKKGIKMTANEVSAEAVKHEAKFDALLAAAQYAFDCLQVSKLPSDIHQFAHLTSTQLLSERVGHLRNIRVHWKNNGKYFYYNSILVPLTRDTRSVRWYKEKYPSKHPRFTYTNGGNYNIGGAITVKSIKNFDKKLRPIVNNYFLE